MTNVLLVLDPGVTTGVGVFRVGDTGVSMELLRAIDTSDLAYVTPRLMRAVEQAQPTMIIIEDFVLYRSASKHQIGQRLFTSELIGVIEAIAALNSLKVFRLPAHAKSKWPVSRVKKWYPDWWTQAKSEHEKDTIRLCLAFLQGVKHEKVGGSSGARPR